MCEYMCLRLSIIQQRMIRVRLIFVLVIVFCFLFVLLLSDYKVEELHYIFTLCDHEYCIDSIVSGFVM